MMCSGPLLFFENVFEEKYAEDAKELVSPAALPGRGTAHPAVLPDGCALPRRIRWGILPARPRACPTLTSSPVCTAGSAVPHTRHRCPALSSMHTTLPQRLSVSTAVTLPAAGAHLCILRTGVVHTVVGAPVAKGAAVHQLIAAVGVQDPARDGLRGGRRS